MLTEMGIPTPHSPPWLRLVHADALAVLNTWSGFTTEWQTTIEQDCTDQRLADYMVEEQEGLRITIQENTEQEEGGERFTCPDCQAEFASAHGRQMHWQLTHGQISELREAKCPLCLRVFSSVRNAREHLRPKKDGQPSCGKKIKNPLAADIRGAQGPSVKPPRQTRQPVRAKTWLEREEQMKGDCLCGTCPACLAYHELMSRWMDSRTQATPSRPSCDCNDCIECRLSQLLMSLQKKTGPNGGT